MKYFDTLPNVLIVNPNGTSTVFKNLMARASIISDILSNPVLFYKYDVKDGETPEIIADKYYGDSYRYWLVMFSNQILDPQWDWPLSSLALQDYITNKYTEFSPYSTVHHYEKNVSQYDSQTGVTTNYTTIIDQNDYNTLQTGSVTYTFPTSTCTITTTGRSVSYYEYELETNEAKRSITLLRKDYAVRVEQELSKLMRQ